jgi:hypothetical protein
VQHCLLMTTDPGDLVLDPNMRLGPYCIRRRVSLSPHRSLAFVPTAEPESEREAAVDPGAPTFEQTVLDNLRAAGVQNGRRSERLTSTTWSPTPAPTFSSSA